MKKLFNMVIAACILCAALQGGALAEGIDPEVDTIFYENFEHLETADLEDLFVVKGNDTVREISVATNPIGSGKVLKSTNKLYAGSGSLWHQVTFAGQDVLEKLAAQDKDYVVMDFSVLFDEVSTAYTSYFFGNAPSANNTYIHGLGQSGTNVFSQYGVWSSRRGNLTTEMKTDTWYEARVAYHFDKVAEQINLKVFLRESGTTGAPAVQGWTKILDFSFPDTNITVFSLLYNYMPQGTSYVGQFGSVYMDEIKIFTTKDPNCYAMVAPRFTNDSGKVLVQPKNGDKVRFGVYGVALENRAYKLAATMALYDAATNSLLQLEMRNYPNSAWRATAGYMAGYSTSYLTIPDEGEYILKAFVWNVGTDNVTTMEPRMKPLVYKISEEEEEE